MSFWKTLISTESKYRNDAQWMIKITDYGDEVALTINGIKAMTITDVKEGIEKLKELREEYVRKKMNE